jgi:putative transposase
MRKPRTQEGVQHISDANIKQGRQTKDKLAAQRRAAEVGRRVRGELKRIERQIVDPILLKNYFLPSDSDLETHIGAFMDHYNHQRYHESLNNVTPSDVYFERDKAILKQRERIKQNTLEAQRLYHRKQTA